MQIVDLTHTLSADIPSWDGSCCFSLKINVDYQDCHAPNLFRVQSYTSIAGAGTHIDAPAHCFPGSDTVDRLPLHDLTCDGIVIRVDDRADEHYRLTPDVIEEFERHHGRIPVGAFVIVYTGWERHWPDPERYRNNLVFPSLHADAASLLLTRGVAGIGIDTLSPDALGKDFPVHRIILGAGKYLVENVAHALEVPATGSKISIMPMKIGGGTEAPIRLVAQF